MIENKFSDMFPGVGLINTYIRCERYSKKIDELLNKDLNNENNLRELSEYSSNQLSNTAYLCLIAAYNVAFFSYISMMLE